MKRFFRYFLYFILLLVVGLGITYFVLNKPLPEGQEGPAAEQLTDKMLAAVNADAWAAIPFLEWNFPRGHHFFWDRGRNLVEVTWDKNRVLLNPESGVGAAYADGKKVGGEAAEKLVEKARIMFWNDSFWLMAFTKVRDGGTTRKLVKLEEGGEGLLVTYSSGGDTPGDSYLWLLKENGLPYAWRMWVNIIPVGGLEFTWDNWYALPNGAMVAPSHEGSLFNVDLFDIKAGNSMQEMGREKDIFAEIL